MSNIRTANRRHKRALTLTILRGKQPETLPVEKTEPARAEV